MAPPWGRSLRRKVKLHDQTTSHANEEMLEYNKAARVSFRTPRRVADPHQGGYILLNIETPFQSGGP